MPPHSRGEAQMGGGDVPAVGTLTMEGEIRVPMPCRKELRASLPQNPGVPQALETLVTGP